MSREMLMKGRGSLVSKRSRATHPGNLVPGKQSLRGGSGAAALTEPQAPAFFALPFVTARCWTSSSAF
jgi:hypothetical protein